MIDTEKIKKIVQENIDDPKTFLVDIKSGTGNKITVYIDKFDGLSLRDCEILHKKIYPYIEELADNFDLTVSSPGLDTNFKVWQQFLKNKGKEISVTTIEGEKFSGIILDASADKVTLEVKNQTVTLDYNQISKAKVNIKF